MGIQGLLPLLKSIMLPVHAKDLEGCCVAVDTYSWLHKGALSCSRELCKGIPTSKHINYCMHRVNLLRHYGVKPILVFDGGFLPMKGDQETKRARVRKESLSRAIEHESNGNQTAAYECYQKAVDISPSVAYDLIQVLKQECVQYVVAPYEADAEMTLLAVTKQVDAVITEDSDLIAFGCPRIIYKMDKYGQGVEFQFSMLKQNKELNFTGFTKQMVLEMCILSGCDYLQSLPGMGLKKAHALMKKFRSYDKVIKHLRYSTVAVPPFYEESFKKAIMTFLHQRVYDPVSEELIHLSEVPACGDEDLEFLGPVLTPEVAKGIARGELDPLTKMPFQKDIDGTAWNYTQSNQQKIFKPEVLRNKPDLPAQKNLLTKYFCIASIEAKQEFRAPWVVPIHPNPEDGSPSALLDSFTEDDSCELGSSSVSPPVREEENNVNDIASATGDCHLESTSNGIHEELVSDDQGMHNQTPFRHSICKPCVLLHKDRASSLSKSKTIITENGKVVVRSSYFLPKKTGKENISDESANDICKSTISAEECPSASVAIDAKMKTVNPITTLKSFEFQCDSTEEKYNSKVKSEKKKIMRSRNSLEDAIAAEVDETVKPESSLRYNDGTLSKQKDTVKELKASCNVFGDSSPNDHFKPNFAVECPSASVAIEGKMKTVDPITTLRSFEFQHNSAEEKSNSKMKSEKRKVVKSSYFQQQVSSNRNSTEDAIAAEVDETLMPENCLRHNEGNLRKRKVAFNNSNENDTVKGLKASRNTFVDPACDNYDSTGEVKADNMKFGSDVSHLGKYGEISEKSVEKFVSVISSFKFTSNGSRASGLRAPLKDIRNVSKSREMDLDRFVYLPTKQKPYSARRKT